MTKTRSSPQVWDAVFMVNYSDVVSRPRKADEEGKIDNSSLYVSTKRTTICIRLRIPDFGHCCFIDEGGQQ